METACSPISASLDELVQLAEPARRLRLAPQVARARQWGQYLSRLRGRGMEYAESRPYEPGDDLRNMDWRVTARMGRPFSKLFREERERPVLLLVDGRATLFFATRGRFKWVRVQQAAALLAWAAHRGGDRVGGELYTGARHREFQPRRGKGPLLRFLKALTDHTPAAAGGGTLVEPLRRLQHTAHPGSLVVVLSDFIGFDEAMARRLVRLARHNDLVLFEVHDPLEAEPPPPGRYPVTDGSRRGVLDSRGDEAAENHRRRYRDRVEQLRRLCRQHGMTWLQCATDQDPVALLTTAFGKR